MKTALKIIAALVVICVVVGFLVPKTYTVERKIRIDAPPAIVHGYVSDLKKWSDWSVWKEKDPTLVVTLGEKTKGVGAHQSWTGKDGDGDLTLTKVDAKTGVDFDMNFIMDGKPIPSKGSYSYATIQDQLEVTWTMKGDWKGAVPPVVDGWMSLMSGMMMGPSFERGLELLKEVSEKKPEEG
jgi:uncharacterized protein YndB with AHSA1/START domain